MEHDPDVAAVEAAMVAIRRRQNRKALAHQAAGDRPLSARELSLLAVLDVVEEAADAGERATVGSVARVLDVDAPRASKLVSAAIGAGLVERRADQADGRRAFLLLTADGRAQLDRVHRSRRRAFAAAMQDWSDAERRQFARLLTRFVAALGEGPPAEVRRRGVADPG